MYTHRHSFTYMIWYDTVYDMMVLQLSIHLLQLSIHLLHYYCLNCIYFWKCSTFCLSTSTNILLHSLICDDMIVHHNNRSDILMHLSETIESIWYKNEHKSTTIRCIIYAVLLLFICDGIIPRTFKLIYFISG